MIAATFLALAFLQRISAELATIQIHVSDKHPPIIHENGEVVQLERYFLSLLEEKPETHIEVPLHNEASARTLTANLNDHGDLQGHIISKSARLDSGSSFFKTLTGITNLAAAASNIECQTGKVEFAGCWQKVGDCSNQIKDNGFFPHANFNRCFDIVAKLDDDEEKEFLQGKGPCYKLETDVWCPLIGDQASPWAKFWFAKFTGQCRHVGSDDWKKGEYSVPIAVSELGCRANDNNSCGLPNGANCCGDCNGAIHGFGHK